MLEIHQKFAEIVKSKETGDHVLKQLKALQARSEKAEKIRGKDFIKLIDKQHKAELDRDQLMSELQMMEFRCRIRK